MIKDCAVCGDIKIPSSVPCYECNEGKYLSLNKL